MTLVWFSKVFWEIRLFHILRSKDNVGYIDFVIFLLIWAIFSKESIDPFFELDKCAFRKF